MTIQFINPKINNDNLTTYFKKISILGDGNCGIHSIIYAMNKNTNIKTYKNYHSKKNKRGEIYYDEEVTLLFRKELEQIYEEKIIELKNKKTYKDRKKVILKDKESLNDVDIQLYGEKYNMCIGLFETNPFRFTIVSNRSNGFDNCENTIFLYNIIC